MTSFKTGHSGGGQATVPEDMKIGDKENEKVEKYLESWGQIARRWNMKTVLVVPIVAGSLGSKPRIYMCVEMLDIKISTSLRQKEGY